MKLRKVELALMLLMSVLLGVIVAGNVFLNRPFFKSFAKTALSKQPERFTELYFTDHLNLPKEIELETDYSFAFTVHNLEYQDFDYVCEVRSDSSIFGRGHFFLRHDELKTIPITFRISQPFERKKITVNLVNKNQLIHFWVEEI